MFNILIRQLSIEDASISFRWRNDPEIWQYTGNRPDKFITEEIEKNWLAEKLNEKNSSRFAIIIDNQYIGNIQITDIIERDKGQYHIFIGEKSFWDKGIAKQVTAQIIRFAKEKLNLKELYLIVSPSNLAAIKLYEKSGFIKVNNEIRMSLKLIDAQPPVVSVFVMTYNHEHFISQALEGILFQRTNFDFDIVVGEDCSIDNTRKIVLGYSDKYPGKFKLLLHEHNIGAMTNQISILHACTGKYIAICEGDDYWTDPYKLQKQFDFLESNQEYGMVHTNLDIYLEETKRFKRKFHSENNFTLQGYIFEDLLIDNSIATLTTIFRTELLKKINLNHINRFKMGDLFLWLEIAKYSKIGYIQDVTAVYRMHSNSLSQHGAGAQRIEFLKSSFEIKDYFIEKYGCSRETEEKVYRKALVTWYSFKSVSLFRKCYYRLKSAKMVSGNDKIKFWIINYSFLYSLDLLIRRAWNFLRKQIFKTLSFRER